MITRRAHLSDSFVHLERVSRRAASLMTSSASAIDPHSGVTLTTEILTTSRQLHALGSDWNALHRVSSSTNPFNHWLWVLHWWQWYGRSSTWVHDRLHIHVQRDQFGTIRAILPFVITTRGVGLAAVRKLRLFGSVPAVALTELPQVLIWPGFEAACTCALIATLRRHEAEYDWGEVDGLLLDGPLGRSLMALTASNGWTQRPTTPYYTFALPSNWEALRATLKRHIKKNIRNSHAALARDNHVWRMETVTETADLELAMSEFFRLHAARATCGRGPSHPDHFASSRTRGFLLTLARDLLAEQRFMICRLRVGRDIVASRLIFLSGGCFYLYHSGFDPAWWRYSVSTTLTAECIKLAIARGAQTVNLSTGRDDSKLRWGPQEHLIGGLAFSSRAAKSRTLTATRDLTKLIEQYVRAFGSRQT